MSDSWEEFEEDVDETTYAQGRLASRTYVSKSFPLKRTNSLDDGTPARFVCKVFDPESETTIVREFGEWVIRETPAGRYQFKLLVARQPGNVKELRIERVPSTGQSGSVRTLLNLKQPEATRLIELIRALDAIPVEGDTTVRVDDDLIRDLFANPSSLGELYRKAPKELRQLITSDEAARDVLALSARRKQVALFRRLLTDNEFFDGQVAKIGRGSAERVWQELFERNPWMLGVTLAGQLLMSWSDERLEQVVAGSSIGGSGKRTDALLRTAGRIRSMVFAEIKTHRTSLLGKEYRSGCWSVSPELSGAVAQLQGTVHRAVTQIGDRLPDVDELGADVPGSFTYLLRPRSFVILGQLAELTGTAGGDHQDKVRSFELFRRQLQEPELITFDEVLARAEWTLQLAEDAEGE